MRRNSTRTSARTAADARAHGASGALNWRLVPRAAKIAVSESGESIIELGFLVEPGPRVGFVERTAKLALQEDVHRIVNTARATVRKAQIRAEEVDAVYFTGGSTGLDFLAAQLAEAFPAAQAVRGDRYASVVSGLAITAHRRFAPAVASEPMGGGLSS